MPALRCGLQTLRERSSREPRWTLAPVEQSPPRGQLSRERVNAAFRSAMVSKAEKMAALGVVSKEELAGLAVFLASSAAAKITGQAISMTGGISAL